MMNEEKTRLADIASQSLYCAGVNRDTIVHCFDIFKRFMNNGSILEMGPAEGIMTDLLVDLPNSLTVVEGSEIFCQSLTKRHPSINVVHALFEEYKPTQKFDNIILGHVLEHVEDPVDILRHARNWLTPTGQILAAVPNSRSLHRQAAVIMEMLSFEEQLNEPDRHHGHRRVYNPETYRRDFLAAGLKIKQFGGYWMKPLSNKQIEDSWSPELLKAFMTLGERYPDIAGEIYVVAGL
ncbi:class I SAM-dependent methyltransferase [Govanella unica]|uniref:Class I SAM-dependent methyltransferase n=1 Tax=Govanella unica TaxID=2975056 RepID=A0A9X3TVL0_9PROT|nr:class I SAM-dependent methyltransferase [Govania unica]MDA5192507.1 class I SAM-dependent methyltransferase [Govania unica]